MCQIWWPCAPSDEELAGYPQEVVQEYCSGTRVLQAPVRDLASIEQMTVEQVQEMQQLFDAIADLSDGQIAFYLLRSYFGSCRLAYNLHCVPPEASLRAADLYDRNVEDCLRRLIGGVLPHEIFKELQLPVKVPRPSFCIGLLSAASTASFAYLTSRITTKHLVQSLLSWKSDPITLDDVLVDGAFRDYADAPMRKNFLHCQTWYKKKECHRGN